MSASSDIPAEPVLPEEIQRRSMTAWQRGLILLLTAAVAVVPAFVLESFQLFQLTMAVIMALAVLGLNIVTGYSGQISLGHGAFYAVGAYTTAILMSHWGVPYWLTIPVAGAVCLVTGVLFGLCASRLENLYLALATFGLGVSLPQILKYKHI